MNGYDRRRRGQGSLSPAGAIQRQAGKRSRVELRYGDLQRKVAGSRPEDAPRDQASFHDAARQGVAGTGGTLPFIEQIQPSFGEHDLSEVRAHVGGAAAEAAKSIGAEAYATGTDVAFGGSPDLHTAAHEAAHVVQQRAGVHLKGGLGADGDDYERNADAVADRVVSGRSAADLLPPAGTDDSSTGGEDAPLLPGAPLARAELGTTGGRVEGLAGTEDGTGRSSGAKRSGSAERSDDGPSIPFTIPLPEDVRALITAAHETFRTTKKVPDLGEIRRAILRKVLEWAVPTTPTRAAELAAPFQIAVDDARLLPSLVTGATGKAKRVYTVTILQRDLEELRQKPVSLPSETAPQTGPTPLPQPVPQPHPTPVPQPGQTEAPFDIGGWLWGLVQGDFNENPDIAQTLVNGLVGLIPGVDQALDLRDLGAALYKLIYLQRYDEPGVWFDFVVTLIGAIPEIGSVLKPVIKLIKRGVGTIPVRSIVELVGELAPFGRLLDDFLARFGSYADAISAKAVAILEWLAGRFGQVLDAANRFSRVVGDSARAFIKKLADGARAALAAARAKIAAALEELKRMLAELRDRLLKQEPPTNDVRPSRTRTPESPRTRTPESPRTKAPDAPNRADLPLDEHIGSGGNADVYTVKGDPGSVMKVLKQEMQGVQVSLELRQLIVRELVTMVGKARAALGDIIVPLEEAAPGVLRQPRVGGLTFDELGKEAQNAAWQHIMLGPNNFLQRMNRALGSDLLPGYAVDINPANFRFAADGRITAAFDCFSITAFIPGNTEALARMMKRAGL